MRTTQLLTALIFLVFCTYILSSCKKKEDPIVEEVKNTGKISISFIHNVDSSALIKDTMLYTNAAGNKYEVNELKYFISDVKLYASGGTVFTIDDEKDIWYVDNDISTTMTWNVFDKIPEGAYDSMSFTFGINAAKNKPFLFVNPPEVNMMWPNILGGGFHYLMLNGRWTDTVGLVSPFNFHLGIGQLYSGTTASIDSITAFVQNYFSVHIANSAFTISKDVTTQLELTMHIESWFKTPSVYNHNYWKGDIMQKQPAMQMAKENGGDVFSFRLK